MSIIDKSQRVEARRLVKESTDLVSRMDELLARRTTLTREIAATVEVQLDLEAKALLSEMGVGELNRRKEGIRVSALEHARITNVQQVLEHTPQSLSGIRGIGIDSADKILFNAHQLERETRRSLRPHLDPDKRDDFGTTIVHDLYVLVNGQEAFERLDKCRPRATDLAGWSTSAHRASGFLGCLFSGTATKQKGLDADSRLRDSLPDFTANIDGIEPELNALTAVEPSAAWRDFTLRAAAYYTLLYSITGFENVDATKGSLSDDLVQKVLQTPLDLSLMRSTLRPYQDFGARYALCQKRTLLGDEMGLGKTVEAIASMASLAGGGDRHFVVVCPLGVLINWQREVPRHSKLSAIAIYGPDRDAEFAQWEKAGGVALTTYETTSRLAWSSAPTPAMLIVDEAHYVKNPNAARTKAVVALASRASHVLYMSGTPLENRVEEMNFLIACLQPKVAKQATRLGTSLTASEYRRAVSPVYLRRTREDVLTELPEKIEMEDWCTFTETDLEAYKRALQGRSFSDARRVSWSHDRFDDSAKAERLAEIVDDARNEGRLVLIFSYFLDTLAKVKRLLGSQCVGIINGSTPAKDRQGMIDGFANATPGSALVCQVTAGGVGLNIQAASVVVFCEPQLKPSTESQAIARSYRMGQVRCVVVHRLLMADSVDERITKLLENKTADFNRYANKSEIGAASLGIIDKHTMGAIIQEELDRYGLSGDAVETEADQEPNLQLGEDGKGMA